ncbi:MAG: hypothetical protein Greene041679_495, partial [Parcubacteria group bacterium Greene0416_79]
RTKLRYVYRGARASKTYQDCYPSLNATFNLTDNFLLRAAYARTLGRPDLGEIIPGGGSDTPTEERDTLQSVTERTKGNTTNKPIAIDTAPGVAKDEIAAPAPGSGVNLDVRGGAIKATGGFILETRTSDPSYAEGRMWLRTDTPIQ